MNRAAASSLSPKSQVAVFPENIGPLWKKDLNKALSEVDTLKANPSYMGKPAIKEVTESFYKTFKGKESITPEELYSFLKNSIDGKINYDSKSLTTGSRKALMDMQQAIRGKLNKSLGSQYTEANDVYSTIADYQKFGGEARQYQVATGTRPVLSKESAIEIS